MTNQNLTPRQQRLLAFIRLYFAEHQTCPSYQEMAAAVGNRSVSVIHKHVVNLESKGFITRGRSRKRSIRLAEELRGEMAQFLDAQRSWSLNTFGPGLLTQGITAHIAKELQEILAAPLDTEEWVDVILLAADGYWRAGGERLGEDLRAKQAKNRARTWVKGVSEDIPAEHDRTT